MEVTTLSSSAGPVTSSTKDGKNGQRPTFPAVFTTCPFRTNMSREEHLCQVVSIGRWSEQAGCTGILIYTDNSTLDPWMIAQVILQNTRMLCPLVAVQPVYLHPYSVAK